MEDSITPLIFSLHEIRSKNENPDMFNFKHCEFFAVFSGQHSSAKLPFPPSKAGIFGSVKLLRNRVSAQDCGVIDIQWSGRSYISFDPCTAGGTCQSLSRLTNENTKEKVWVNSTAS
jgi:hypothetical protein